MEGKPTTEKPEAFVLTSSPGCCDGDGSGGVWGGAAGEASRRSSGSACFIWRTLVWFMAGLFKVLAVEARHPASLALCKGKISGTFLRAKQKNAQGPSEMLPSVLRRVHADSLLTVDA